MYAFAAPIPAGKTAAVRQLTETCLGARKAEYDDMQRRSGITNESYWIQEDPAGDSMVVVSSSDQTDFMEIMKNPQTDFDRWYRAQITEIFGIDPGEPWGPRNQLIGSWPG